MQLRTIEGASTWATLLAAVAIRAERLKHLARNDPNAPASIELTPTEIEATILLKRRQKKRTESIPDGVPSIANAVLWIAELGSFAGKRGDQPGAVTIARGLDKVRTAAEIIEHLRASGQIR
jgi:Transposase Tn5 dimerisation domain